MCLLSYYPQGQQPDTTRLERGARTNRDGYGWGIVTARGTLMTGRGLTADEAITGFAGARKRNPDGPAMFHSRMASSGDKKSLANCHPFHIAGDRKTVLAHNGVLFDMKGDPRCDTKYFAETAMKPWGFTRFDRPQVRTALEKWLGNGNKMVVLTVNRRYKNSAYIFNEDAGVWDEGEWHSNNGYKPYLLGARSYRAGFAPAWAEPAWDVADPSDHDSWVSRLRTDTECVACLAKGTVAFGYCEVCGTCQDCGAEDFVCLCYVPPAARRELTAGASASSSDEEIA